MDIEIDRRLIIAFMALTLPIWILPFMIYAMAEAIYDAY